MNHSLVVRLVTVSPPLPAHDIVLRSAFKLSQVGNLFFNVPYLSIYKLGGLI